MFYYLFIYFFKSRRKSQRQNSVCSRRGLPIDLYHNYEDVRGNFRHTSVFSAQPSCWLLVYRVLSIVFLIYVLHYVETSLESGFAHLCKIIRAPWPPNVELHLRNETNENKNKLQWNTAHLFSRVTENHSRSIEEAHITVCFELDVDCRVVASYHFVLLCLRRRQSGLQLQMSALGERSLSP